MSRTNKVCLGQKAFIDFFFSLSLSLSHELIVIELTHTLSLFFLIIKVSVLVDLYYFTLYNKLVRVKTIMLSTVIMMLVNSLQILIHLSILVHYGTTDTVRLCKSTLYTCTE